MPPPQKTGLGALVNGYLAALKQPDPRRGLPELEIRFGGAKGFRRLGGADSDRVVSRLRSLGFTLSPEEHVLRIAEAEAGRGTRVRVELRGLREISSFCETNQLSQGGGQVNARFESKGPLSRGLGPEDNTDLEFRASLQLEKGLPESSRPVRDILARWSTADKHYRYMNRITLRSAQFPVRVDVSVVKAARGREVTTSGLLARPVAYEVEIEVEGDKVGTGTAYDTAAQLEAAVRRVITYVLQGIQGTNYPVGNKVRGGVMSGYAELVGATYNPGRPLRSWSFAGPSSVTLQVSNIAAPNPESTVPNVREGYTVTDKADGERKLLYVAEGGRVFLITTNMEVQFSGAVADASLAGTLIDGEHIARGKKGEHINLYAAFDVYWRSGEPTRDLPFVAQPGKASRLATLVKTVSAANLRGGGEGRPSPMRLVAKTFEIPGGTKTVFDACGAVLRRQADGLFEYETDGLILTPAHLAVGASAVDSKASPAKKATWSHSFKWKPPEQNTIDFLVVFKKAAGSEQDVVGNLFQAGSASSS